MNKTLAQRFEEAIEQAKADEARPEGYALQSVADELFELLWNVQHRGDVLGITVTLKDFESDLEAFAKEVRQVGQANT